MKRLYRSLFLLFSVMAVLNFSSAAFAAHPLITDDTGTQGKGKFQLEVNGQYSRDSEDGTVQNSTQLSTALTYGVVDNLDVAVGFPFQYTKTKSPVTNDDGSTSTETIDEDGLSDISVAFKWRFFESEKYKLSFALKPGITLPSGSSSRGLGTGDVTYSLFFITTKEIEPVTLHLNLGYIRNENKTVQREDLWHMSLATEIKLIKSLRFVTNAGVQKNASEESHVEPAFILGGLIYSLTDSLDIDAGYKHSLNRPEADSTVMAGVTFKF